MANRGRRHRFHLASTGITRGALYLLFLEVGLSLVFLLSEGPARVTLVDWLSASSVQVWRDFKFWTLVTSPLLQLEFIALLFNALLLWMFLPVLERWWGTKKFLLFALWTSLAATFAGTLFGFLIGDPTPVAGLDPFMYAGIVAYGVLYSDQQVRLFGVLPMTGRQLMIGIIGFAALFVILGQQWVSGVAYASAMGLSWLLTTGRWNPRLWLLRWKHKRVRSKLRVVRDDDDPKKWVN